MITLTVTLKRYGAIDIPYNWNGDYIPPKANKSPDTWGQKDNGGVGRLIYHPSRYKDYILANDREEYCAFPICKLGYEPTFPADDSVSSNGLLVSFSILPNR